MPKGTQLVSTRGILWLELRFQGKGPTEELGNWGPQIFSKLAAGQKHTGETGQTDKVWLPLRPEAL